MRDIVTVSYNHTPKNKTEFKSYRDFLENYNDGNSKDDVESVSSTDSGVSSYKPLESKSSNTSTSSLNSDVNGTTTIFSKAEPTPSVVMGGSRTGSFRNYLDNYSNKKYYSVKPIIAGKPNAATTVKSELVIQVTDPLDKVSKFVTQRAPSPAPQHKPTSISCVVIPKPPPTPPVFEVVAASIPKPSTLLEATTIPPPPPPFPQAQQISNIPPPPPPPGLLNGNTPSQKWATIETEFCHPGNNDQPKIPKSNVAAANLAKILNEHVLARRKIVDAEETSPNDPAPKSKTPSPHQPHQKLSQVPKLPPKALRATNGPNISDNSPKSSTLPRQFPNTSPKQGFSARQRSQSPSPKPSNGCDYNVDSIDFCTTTVVPVVDGSTSLDKGDPNVKKLVYNTYRGLLGAYNNKANDMISTLPRNMVREDKGVGKQLESIALQCRLDKLNGRINPKLEQE